MSGASATESRKLLALLFDPAWSGMESPLVIEDYRKGHLFWKAGTRIRRDDCRVVFILEGQVNVSSEEAEITQVPIARLLGAGELFGLIGFLAAEKHTASCRAMTPVKAASMTQATFKELCQKQAHLASSLMLAMTQQLARDIRACNGRLTTAILGGAAKK